MQTQVSANEKWYKKSSTALVNNYSKNLNK